VIARRGLTLAVLLAAAALAAGCARAPAAGVRAAAIVGGSDDAGDGAVVAIIDRRSSCDDGELRIVCSGSLIAPRVVLTAAHCLQEQGTDGTWEVYVGSPVGGDAQGRFFVVTDAAVDPAWNAETHERDLALLRLADAPAAAPLPLPAAPLPASIVGATVRVIGYGSTAAGAMPDGVRRQTTLRVSTLEANLFRAEPAPGNSCGGDSGGPVLGDLGAGEQLLGVTVSGDAACQSYALQARVDVAMAAFVQPYLDATAALPPGRPAGAIDAAALCETACAGAGDCPDGLACVPATPERAATCAVNAAAPVDYGAECAHDADCGGGQRCARLWPDGADACRCATPCAGAGPPPTPPAGGHGCSLGGGATTPFSTLWALWAATLAALATRRRRRRRRAGDGTSSRARIC
jgi:V8-like Glu-specific endopeptidase